jgi:putative transcriptional regulator
MAGDQRRAVPGGVGRRRVLRGLALLVLPVPVLPAAAAILPAAAVDEPVAANLAGQLVVASRDLTDPSFAEAVVYMMAHDEGGGVGLIVNQPGREVALAEIFTALGLDKAGVEGRITVYVGGPVEPGRPFLLHTPDMTMKESKPLPGGVVLTSDPAMLKAIGRGKGPARHLFAFGYVGWDGGQLEGEIERGDWFVIPPELSLIFAAEPAQSWKRALERRPTAL